MGTRRKAKKQLKVEQEVERLRAAQAQRRDRQASRAALSPRSAEREVQRQEMAAARYAERKTQQQETATASSAKQGPQQQRTFVEKLSAFKARWLHAEFGLPIAGLVVFVAVAFWIDGANDRPTSSDRSATESARSVTESDVGSSRSEPVTSGRDAGDLRRRMEAIEGGAAVQRVDFSRPDAVRIHLAYPTSDPRAGDYAEMVCPLAVGWGAVSVNVVSSTGEPLVSSTVTGGCRRAGPPATGAPAPASSTPSPETDSRPAVPDEPSSGSGGTTSTRVGSVSELQAEMNRQAGDRIVTRIDDVLGDGRSVKIHLAYTSDSPGVSDLAVVACEFATLAGAQSVTVVSTAGIKLADTGITRGCRAS